jgi:ribose transport system ATP-binding protein
VSFELERGTIHALLGGNGSGKSTTNKILAGVHDAVAGTIEIDGHEFDATSFTPARAREAGLRFVHQQGSTFADLSVAENLAIGRGFETGAIGRIRWRSLHAHAGEVLKRFNVDADPGALLGELSPATRAIVAIARALQDQEDAHSGVLVLDEPTASLPTGEVKLLLDALRQYAAAGQTILYVTHRLDEVVEVVDRATVLRDGRLVRTLERSEIDHETLVEAIMGKRAEELLERPPAPLGAPVLEVTGLSGGCVRGASFSVHAGEIVGLAGLTGSGRSTLLKLLFGAIPVEAGEAILGGEPVRAHGPREAMEAGIGYVPEDRLAESAFLDMSVVENVGLTTLGVYFRRGRLDHRAERRDTRELVGAYAIKAEALDSPLGTLSGGNQQKAVLARWLRRDPRLLLLDEPTQGVDVGARVEIWQHVRRAVEGGACALAVTSDLEELPRVCDRVLVLRGGRIVAELAGGELSEHSLTAAL